MDSRDAQSLTGIFRNLPDDSQLLRIVERWRTKSREADPADADRTQDRALSPRDRDWLNSRAASVSYRVAPRALKDDLPSEVSRVQTDTGREPGDASERLGCYLFLSLLSVTGDRYMEGRKGPTIGRCLIPSCDTLFVDFRSTRAPKVFCSDACRQRARRALVSDYSLRWASHGADADYETTLAAALGLLWYLLPSNPDRPACFVALGAGIADSLDNMLARAGKPGQPGRTLAAAYYPAAAAARRAVTAGDTLAGVPAPEEAMVFFEVEAEAAAAADEALAAQDYRRAVEIAETVLAPKSATFTVKKTTRKRAKRKAKGK